MVIQLIMIMIITYFLGFKEIFYNVDKRVSAIAYRSYTWCIGMLFVTGGGVAFLAYLFSETAFYQLYVLDELPQNVIGQKISGVLMGAAYFIGVVALWAVNPSDKKSIKFGITFSFLSILAYYAIESYNVLTLTRLANESYNLYIKIILQFLFAFGFGFSVPALFSLMSNNVHSNPTLSSSKKHFSDLYSRYFFKHWSVHESRYKAHRSLGDCRWGHQGP
jgi:hypothetical protein